MNGQAGKGLRIIFFAHILWMIAAACGIVMEFWSRLTGGGRLTVLVAATLLGCKLVAFVAELVGLNTAVSVHEAYGYAWTATIISIVVSIVGTIVGEEGLAGNLLTMISNILDMAVVYFMCTATAELLVGKMDECWARRGLAVRRIYVVFTVVSLVCTLLSGVPLIHILTWACGMIATVMLLVAGVLFLIFLYYASESLMA